jgi:diguanylate cyclase (GGDEF)-like protein/PAS domain S-box-containing protein
MTYVNSTLAIMFGYLPADLIGADPLILIHSDDHALVTENIRRLISGEIKNLQYEFHGICKNGKPKNIEVIGMGIVLDGRPAILGNALDITAIKQAEEALRFERDFAEGVIETAQTIVLVLDSQGCVVRVNPYMEEISGYALAEVQGKDWIGTFVPERYRESSRNLFQKALEDIYSRGNVSPIVTKDGRDREIEWYNKTLRDMQGNIVYLLSIGQDITEHKQVEESLRHLSTHDAMTGLYNQGFFVEEMARLERGRNFPVSVIMADVDHLKQTNDQYGHAVGDTLLKHIAQVLSAAFRAEDVVARVGGDEFAVLLPATDANSAKTSLQRVQKIIQENNINHNVPPIRLSLGVSTAGSPTPLGGVLKDADANMYTQKRRQDAS